MRFKELLNESIKDMLSKIVKKLDKEDFLVRVDDDFITISDKNHIKRGTVKILPSGNYMVTTKMFRSGKGDPSNVINQIEKELKKQGMKRIE